MLLVLARAYGSVARAVQNIPRSPFVASSRDTLIEPTSLLSVPSYWLTGCSPAVKFAPQVAEVSQVSRGRGPPGIPAVLEAD